MPARKKTTKKPPSTRVRTRAAPLSRSAGFQLGDVVVDVTSPERVGTVCRVVTPGLAYNVRFADDSQCAAMTQSSLAPAPQGTVGPQCTGDC